MEIRFASFLFGLLAFAATVSAACSLTCTFSNNLGRPVVTGNVNCPGASAMSVTTDVGGCSSPPGTADSPFWSCGLFQANGPSGSTMSSGTMAISGSGVSAQATCTASSVPTPTPTTTPSSTPTASPTSTLIPSPTPTPTLAAPYCSTVKIQLNGSSGLQSNIFYGYNWTHSFVDKGGFIPSMPVSAQCIDQNGKSISCSGTIQWTVTSGKMSIDTATKNPDPANQVWTSGNTAGTVTITTMVTGCTNPSASTQFFLDIENACSILPANVQLAPNSYQVFNFKCLYQTGIDHACEYGLGLFAQGFIGSLSVNSINETQTQSTLHTVNNAASGAVVGSGPSFQCSAPVVVSPTPTPTPSPAPTPAPIPLPPNVRFALNCPLPQLGQNKTSVAVFLFVDGLPRTDPAMALDYALNSTVSFETYPVSVDATSGRHDFIMDTRFGGNYSLVAHSGSLSSNACSLNVFQQQSTPLPELNSVLMILTGLLAFGIVQRNARKRI